MNHYICKINDGHGVQFSHVEFPDGQTPLSGFTLDYPKIEVGPEPTSELAWAAWHRKQAELKARDAHYSALYEIEIPRLVFRAGSVLDQENRILYLPTG